MYVVAIPSDVTAQDQVKIPLLCVNAMNDPLICSSLIPYDLPTKNHNIILATTGKGGHLAWCALSETNDPDLTRLVGARALSGPTHSATSTAPRLSFSTPRSAFCKRKSAAPRLRRFTLQYGLCRDNRND